MGKSNKSALMRTLPTQAVRSIGDVADNYSVTFDEALFCLLVALGKPLAHCYKAIRPKVTAASAKTMGQRYGARLRPIISQLSVNSALAALPDWICVDVGTGDGTSPGDRMRAADLLARMHGRLKDQAPGVSIIAQLRTLATPPGEGGGGAPIDIDTLPADTQGENPDEVIDADFEDISEA